jgi:integration host factor subunit alpha
MAKSTKAVTHVELPDAVHRNVRVSRIEASAFVALVQKEIDCVARGETEKLSSFGTFTVRRKSNAWEVPVSARRVVVFKASTTVKRKINGDPRPQEHISRTDSPPPGSGP